MLPVVHRHDSLLPFVLLQKHPLAGHSLEKVQHSRCYDADAKSREVSCTYLKHSHSRNRLVDHPLTNAKDLKHHNDYVDSDR